MKLLYTILLISISLPTLAQTRSTRKSPPLSEASPESVGMSSERLAELDTMCRQAIAKGDLPGVVALVVRNGKIIYNKGFGMAENETGKALKPDAIFRIASQTKAITATAVMMLWEQGKFNLDDPISKYIPEFKNPQVLKSFKYGDTSYTTEPARSEITIRQLLTHTSGLGYGVIDADERFTMMYKKAKIIDAFTTENISIGENIKKLARLPLHHQPGEKFTYSEGLDVLGYFIEVISGEPFDQFLRHHIFDPLGMNDTWFYLPAEKANRLVAVQIQQQGKWIKYPATFYDPQYPVNGARRFFSGGAGLSSTAKDYATFLQMYLNGGELNGVRILSRTTIQSIMGNQTDTLFGGGKNSFYGLAFSVLTENGQASGGHGSAGTFEWGGYFNTQYFADAKEKIIGVLMKQTQGPVSDNTGWMFRQIVEAAVDN